MMLKAIAAYFYGLLIAIVFLREWLGHRRFFQSLLALFLLAMRLYRLLCEKICLTTSGRFIYATEAA